MLRKHSSIAAGTNMFIPFGSVLLIFLVVGLME